MMRGLQRGHKHHVVVPRTQSLIPLNNRLRNVHRVGDYGMRSAGLADAANISHRLFVDPERRTGAGHPDHNLHIAEADGKIQSIVNAHQTVLLLHVCFCHYL